RPAGPRPLPRPLAGPLLDDRVRRLRLRPGSGGRRRGLHARRRHRAARRRRRARSGGGGAGRGGAPYQRRVAALEQPGGPDVYLSNFSGIEPAVLGPSAEIAGLAGIHLPHESAIVQRTSIFSSGPLALFFSFATFDNRAILGAFIDDDHQPVTAFRASVGFSDNGPNQFAGAGGGLGELYVRG